MRLRGVRFWMAEGRFYRQGLRIEPVKVEL